MLLIWTEWTDIARRVMHQAMSYHLVFPLETLAAVRTRAAIHRTVMWTGFRMDICVGIKKILSLERWSITTGMGTFKGCGGERSVGGKGPIDQLRAVLFSTRSVILDTGGGVCATGAFTRQCRR